MTVKYADGVFGVLREVVSIDVVAMHGVVMSYSPLLRPCGQRFFFEAFVEFLILLGIEYIV